MIVVGGVRILVLVDVSKLVKVIVIQRVLRLARNLAAVDVKERVNLRVQENVVLDVRAVVTRVAILPVKVDVRVLAKQDARLVREVV